MEAENLIERIAPQPGPQTQFLKCDADIAIFGGQAGGGKTYGLLLDLARWHNVPKFRATIFRRKAVHITQEGGLWDEAKNIYLALGGIPRGSKGDMDFRWNSDARVGFAHLQMEDTVYDWQGSQMAVIAFDELTHFTKKQFFYMLSRNRSTCGVQPYVRATCNPDADSWVAGFLDWWIDQKTGYAIAERSGVVRWMVKIDEDIHWFASSADSYAWQHSQGIKDPQQPKSVTFIMSSIYDNPALLKSDPGYLSNLQALGRVERERLLGGNWKVRAAGGKFFHRLDFGIVDSAPKDITRTIRYWDLAGTEAKRSRSRSVMADKLTNNPDWTVGLKGVITRDRTIYITDMVRERMSPGKVQELILQTAIMDGRRCQVWIEQEPGQSGKFQIEHYQKKVLLGYTVRADRPTGPKLTRSEPYQAYAEHGHVKLVNGAWNEVYLSEHDAFPDPEVHDDIVDTGSGLFKGLIEKGPGTAQLLSGRRSMIK